MESASRIRLENPRRESPVVLTDGFPRLRLRLGWLPASDGSFSSASIKEEITCRTAVTTAGSMVVYQLIAALSCSNGNT